MSARYSLYGLIVESELPLGGALPGSSGVPDLVIRRGEGRRAAPRPDEGVRRSSVFALSRDGEDFLFDFPDGVQVVVSGDAKTIDVSWPEKFSAQYAATYLINLIMAFVMRARGHEVLHASAALIDDAAVAFIGPSGAGKSTIAAMLALRGFRIIAEDVVAILDRGERFGVVSAHTRVRLWPDATKMLFGGEDALPLIAGAEWKRYLDVSDRFADGEFELAAIYSIDDRREGVAPHVEALEPKEAMLDLIAASYKAVAPEEKMSPAEFDRMGRIVRHVPTRLVVPNPALETAPAMIDAIVEDVRAGKMTAHR